MFKIDLSKTYTYPVTIEIKTEDGKTKKQSFKAKFNRYSQTELDEIIKDSQDNEINDQQLAEKVLVGWEGIQDADGNDLEFNNENRDVVLDAFPVRPSVIEAWFESLQGAKRKNS
jgi:hypothetical protein